LKRLQDIFGLVPVEYPTTRVMGASLQDKAKDVHDALLNSEIKGIICSIGGDDQIMLLKYLDPEIVKNNPKIFMGYSDATNFQLYRWNLGIVSQYGGAIMTQFAMNGVMFDYTIESIQKALFEGGEYEVKHAPEFADEGLNWKDPNLLKQFRKLYPNDAWTWVNENQVVEGTTWGGCLEILDFQLRAGKYLPKNEDLKDTILFFETSEELPSAEYVYRVLVGMGERGMLQQFKAILVGRPKAWEFDKPNTPEQKTEYKKEQQAAILKALVEYNPKALVVFNLDFGHTDPQFIMPNGGSIRIDGRSRKIVLHYGS
jgi:muramoyltetrapeptide carboxypeptidase LdcA involved in peptidoglycan recycling